MKLKNIEILLKRAKGIPYERKKRNREIERITSFGYQLATAETADRIFGALAVALDERKLLTKLEKDLRETFETLDLEERRVLSLTCCKELSLTAAAERIGMSRNETVREYRRGMRDMSKKLIELGYDDFDVEMYLDLFRAD